MSPDQEIIGKGNAELAKLPLKSAVHVHTWKEIIREWRNEENIIGRLISAKGLMLGCDCGEDDEIIKMIDFDLRYA